MKLIKTDNAPGFARDPKTGAVLNINTSELENAKQAKAKRQARDQEIKNLKKDVDDIKLMLTRILEKL